MLFFFWLCLYITHENVCIWFVVGSVFQGLDNKEYSSMLHKALEGAIILESFPKTTVDVFALVLESGGSKCFYLCLAHKPYP